MTSSIMHSCDESDDSLRITSVEVEVEVYVGRRQFTLPLVPDCTVYVLVLI